jgi:hypothetical protein
MVTLIGRTAFLDGAGLGEAGGDAQATAATIGEGREACGRGQRYAVGRRETSG